MQIFHYLNVPLVKKGGGGTSTASSKNNLPYEICIPLAAAGLISSRVKQNPSWGRWIEGNKVRGAVVDLSDFKASFCAISSAELQSYQDRLN